MKKKKLFICLPDLPYPPRKHGLTIRYYPIIEHASKTFDIHLLAICSEPAVPEHVDEIKKLCEKVSIYIRQVKKPSLLKKIWLRLKSLSFIGVPYVMLRYDEADIKKYLIEQTKGEVYDIALNVSVTNSDLVKDYVQYKKYSLDVIDSLYSLILRSPREGLLDFIDHQVISRWEKKTVREADIACYISPLDRTIGAGKKFDDEKIKVIPNGFFLSDYVEVAHDFGCFTIGFIGNMSYPPNVQAALRLAKLFLSVVNKANLNWKLVIIGRLPQPEILALADNEKIIVTGTVDNIWPFVNGADLFVFPMEIGSGQQNKLLEAMCIGKPVVSTRLGNSGIGAKNLEHIIEAETDDEFVSAIKSLASDEAGRKRLGDAAKQFVTEKYSWVGIFEIIDRTLLLPVDK